MTFMGRDQELKGVAFSLYPLSFFLYCPFNVWMFSDFGFSDKKMCFLFKRSLTKGRYKKRLKKKLIKKLSFSNTIVFVLWKFKISGLFSNSIILSKQEAIVFWKNKNGKKWKHPTIQTGFQCLQTKSKQVFSVYKKFLNWFSVFTINV